MMLRKRAMGVERQRGPHGLVARLCNQLTRRLRLPLPQPQE